MNRPIRGIPITTPINPGKFIPVPNSAYVGQVLMLVSVNDDGSPVWAAVDVDFYDEAIGKIDDAVKAAYPAIENANNAIISANNVMNGVRRKVAALAGYTDSRLKEHDTEIAKRKVSVSKVADDGTWVNFKSSTGDGYRSCRISLSPTDGKCYQVTQLMGYNIFDLFSTTATNKTLVGLWIDGTRYEDVEVLKNIELTFYDLMLLYTVNESNYTINTCVCLSADGIKVYESIPETVTTNPLKKVCLRDGANGATAVPLVAKGDSFLIFTIKGDSRYFIHTVEDLGQTVVKTIAFNGRL